MGCFQRLKDFLKKKITHLFFSPGTTPFPTAFCFAMFFMLICNAMTLTMVFSYLPRMTKSFGIAEEDVGRNAGIIASSLFVGRVLTSYIWGLASDLFGKKKMLLLSIICLSLTTFAFGFSVNIYIATTFRFLQGIASGVIVIAKAVIMDMADETNQAFGMTLVTSAWTLGMVIGPSFSGFLVFPVDRWPDKIKPDSFLGTYQVFLPNFILSVLLLFTALLIFFTVKNDKKPSAEMDNFNVDNGVTYGATISERQEETHNPMIEHSKLIIAPSWRRSRLNSGVKASLDTDWTVDIHYIQLIPSTGTQLYQKASIKSITEDDKKASLNRTGKLIVNLLKNKDTIASCFLYLLIGLTSVGFNEILPVWAATEKTYHGLAFSPVTIGILLLVMSLILLVLQPLFTVRLANRLLSKKLFISSSLIFALCAPLVPMTEKIKNQYAFWMVILVIIVVMRFFISCATTANNIFLVNSVHAELVGSASGLGMSFSAFGRAIAPLVFGGIYSWSLKNVKNVYPNGLGFPFNQYLTFFFISLMAILSAVTASFFPKRLNYPKDKEMKMQKQSTEES